VEGADIKYQTRVSEIYGKSTAANGTAGVKTADGHILEFDELVVTTPLGWLKQNLQAFKPPLPDRLCRAIRNIGYGCLEKVTNPLSSTSPPFAPPLPSARSSVTSLITPLKLTCLSQVYISFPKAFWLTPGSDGRIVKGFCQWLSPNYATDTNPERWTNEIVELASSGPDTAHPTLLFYIYGAESKYITSKVRSLPTKDRDEFLYTFFKPY
jgi:hypothetical protein